VAGVRTSNRVLTAEVKPHVIAQFIHYFDPQLWASSTIVLKETNRGHIKQRSRMAPERSVASKTGNDYRIAAEHGMTIVSATG